MKTLISILALVFVCTFATAQQAPKKMEKAQTTKKACCADKDKKACADKATANAAGKKACADKDKKACADKSKANAAGKKACCADKDKKACADKATANAAGKKDCCKDKKMQGKACNGKKMGSEKASAQAHMKANSNSAVREVEAVPAKEVR